MKAPQRVVWSEGLLLGPQHLQQMDRYHEARVDARIDAFWPLSWGVRKLLIDQRALSRGLVAIREFAAILPDGLVLDCDRDRGELPPERSVEGHFPHQRRVLEVYVAVPKEREGQPNVAADDDAQRRYRVRHESRSDLLGDATPLEIPFAQRNVQILFGGENRDPFDCIKVAELVRNDGGSLILSEPFIPAIVLIEASAFLTEALRRLIRLMSQRREALLENRRESSDQHVGVELHDLPGFLLLQTLNTFLPVLNHFVDHPQVSPREAYTWLIALAGQLSSLRTTADPNTLPKYAYRDLRSTFEPLFARITELLQSTVPRRFLSLTLEARQDGMHLGRLEDERFASCSCYVIAVKSPVSEEQTRTVLPTLLKLASWGSVHNILTSAVPGAPVEIMYRTPPEVPVRPSHTYFRVSTDNDFWADIIRSRQLAAYLPHPFDAASTQISLYGVLKD